MAPPRNRMVIAVAALIGALIAVYMLLYKLGMIGELACGAAGSCDTVQASRWSDFLGVPVPAWGVIGYGTIMLLAITGLRPGRSTDRRIAAALFGFSAYAVLFSVYLTALEAFVIEAWCRWCVASALVAALVFAAALPEFPRIRRR